MLHFVYSVIRSKYFLYKQKLRFMVSAYISWGVFGRVACRRALSLLVLVLPISLISVLCLASQAGAGNYDALFNSGVPAVINSDSNEQFSLRSSHDIEEDYLGRILLAGETGIVWFDGFKGHRFKNNHGETVAGSKFIYQIVPFGELGFWYRDSMNLYFYSFQTKKELTYFGGDGFRVFSVSAVTKEKIAVATNRGGYFAEVRQGNIRLSKFSDDQAGQVVELVTGVRGVLFYVQEGMVWRLNLENNKSEPFKNIGRTPDVMLATDPNSIWYFNDSKLVRSKFAGEDLAVDICDVKDLVYSSDGNIWAATPSCGVYAINPVTAEVITRLDDSGHPNLSLQASNINTIFEDSNGAIWIGRFSKGHSYIGGNRSAFSNINNSSEIPSKLLSNAIFYVLVHSSGDIWLAHAAGGITVLNADGTVKKLIEVEPEEGMFTLSDYELGGMQFLPRLPVYALLENDKGEVYAALRGVGVFKVASKDYQVSRVSRGDKSKNLTYYNLIFSNDGVLHASGSEGAYTLSPEGEAVKIENIQDFHGKTKFNHSFVDGEGNIWFAGGQHIAILPGHPRSVMDLHTLGGLSLKNPQRLYNLFITDSEQIYGIIDDAFYSVEYDANTKHINLKKMWKGVDFKGRYFELDDGTLQSAGEQLKLLNNTYRRYNTADALLPQRVFYYARSSLGNGTYLQGSSDGLVVFRPGKLKQLNTAVSIVVTGLEIDGVPVNYSGGEIVLPADSETIAVTVAALDYADPKAIRYAYRVEGYQHKWLESDYTGRKIFLSNLAPGEHVLEVRAKNRAGNWLDNNQAIKLQVIPKWFETYWFRAVVLTLAFILLWLLYRIRVSQLKDQQKHLENTVEERTEELQQSLTQLKNTKDQLVESEKQASLGLLVRGVSHELNTPLGVLRSSLSILLGAARSTQRSFIKGELTQHELDDFIESALFNGSLMDRNVDRMVKITERFKQSSVTELQGSLSVFNLSSLIETCSSSYLEAVQEVRGEIKLDCDPSIRINSYKTVLTSVLDELFSNVLLHAYSSSKFQGDNQFLITVKVRAWGESGVKMFFADNGLGIGKDILPEIFEPFFTSSSNAEQIGLGLHSVFNWVSHSLRGRVDCRSEVGSGTVFILSLKSYPEGTPFN